MREITVIPSGPRPGTRYFRSIEGSDFSLEANTENVPRDGRYYIRQGGEITFSSNQLGDARELYEGLCNGFWRMLMQLWSRFGLREVCRTKFSKQWPWRGPLS